MAAYDDFLLIFPPYRLVRALVLDSLLGPEETFEPVCTAPKPPTS
jgi:hypothetical protein